MYWFYHTYSYRYLQGTNLYTVTCKPNGLDGTVHEHYVLQMYSYLYLSNVPYVTEIKYLNYIISMQCM